MSIDNTPPDSNSAHHRVTLKDIAADIGVSHTTVSLALRGSSKITKAKRDLIQKKAQEMGYQLNPMAAGLAQYRYTSNKVPMRATLGWLNFWTPPEKLRTHREFDLYWQGARDSAYRLGYHLESFHPDAEISPQRLTQILVTRNVQGVLLPPHGGPYLEAFERNLGIGWDSFAIVRFGYTLPKLKVSVVASDHLTNMRIVLDRLRQLGYHRIGYATEELQVSHALDAFMGDWVKQSAKMRVTPLRLPTSSSEHRASVFEKWYKKEKPDAIVTDLAKLSGWLSDIGVKCPEEIGLAAMSVLDGVIDTGINQRSYEIGKAAAEVLISRINNEDRGEPDINREVLVKGEWVQGNMACQQ